MKLLRILVPPGIGDIHWVALKLRSFLERAEARAEVWVLDHDKRPRGLAFVRRLPFVRAGGYYRPGLTEIEMLQDKTFRSCYFTGENDALPGLFGFDFFLCFNGSLRTGKELAQVLPECVSEWDYPVEELAKDRMIQGSVPGRYVLFGLSDFTIFAEWVKAIGEENLRRLLQEIPRRFPGRVPVLTGAEWDVPLNRRFADVALDLTGKTSVGELLSLIRHADAFVGFAGGNGIVATHLGCPTVIVWHATYPALGFRSNWADPKKAGRLYRWIEAEEYTHDALYDSLETVMQAGGKLDG